MKLNKAFNIAEIVLGVGIIIEGIIILLIPLVIGGIILVALGVKGLIAIKKKRNETRINGR